MANRLEYHAAPLGEDDQRQGRKDRELEAAHASATHPSNISHRMSWRVSATNPN